MKYIQIYRTNGQHLNSFISGLPANNGYVHEIMQKYLACINDDIYQTEINPESFDPDCYFIRINDDNEDHLQDFNIHLITNRYGSTHYVVDPKGYDIIETKNLSKMDYTEAQLFLHNYLKEEERKRCAWCNEHRKPSLAACNQCQNEGFPPLACQLSIRY